MDDETADQRAHAETDSILAGLPGASNLIEYCGRVPGFHDGEIEALHLLAKGTSTVTIRIDPNISGKPSISVTFHIEEILDVQLDNFSPQNVIGDLRLRPPSFTQLRQTYLWREPKADDIELEFVPSFGISGSIIGRGLSVSWQKSAPSR